MTFWITPRIAGKQRHTSRSDWFTTVAGHTRARRWRDGSTFLTADRAELEAIFSQPEAGIDTAA